MRYLCLSALLIVSLLACKQPVKGKNGVTYKTAVEYNDYIVNRQTSLMKKIVDWGKVLDENIDSAEIILKQSGKEAEKMIEEIKGMPPYRGDSSLRDAAVKSFSFYKRLFDKDYLTILHIRQKGSDHITENDVTEVNTIIENISKEEETLDKVFHNAQQGYADKNNMKLRNTREQKDLEKEIDKMGKE